jgi:hypothetical protein
VEGRGLDISGSQHGPVACSFEYGNKRSGLIKGGDFLALLGDLLASQEGLCYMELVCACRGKGSDNLRGKYITECVHSFFLNFHPFLSCTAQSSTAKFKTVQFRPRVLLDMSDERM